MAVFVAGALHHDVIVRAPRLPRLDETLVGQGVRYAPGGKGANQAMAAARMGARVAMAGAVGSDAAGETLLVALEGAGVDVTRIARMPGPSGMSVALTDPSGAYGAVIVSEANLDFDPERVTLPADTRFLILQNEIPAPANLIMALKARTQGARLILNAAPAKALDAGLLALTDILIVNRIEAADLTGASPDRATALLAALGPDHVIVTAGAAGLWLWKGGQEAHLPAHAVAVRSTHGAGDAFVGALAAELDRGAELVDAAAFAQGAAALHVSAEEDKRSGAGREDVRRFLAAGSQSLSGR